jgi:hypothetical protein
LSGHPHAIAWNDRDRTRPRPIFEFIRDVTNKMCDRDFDLDLVESTFADDFVHHGNGATTDKVGYLARGREYREQFAGNRPPGVRRALRRR